MGLRLYQAPVESDIKSKPSADKIFSQARSIIRRSRIGSLRAEQQREQRRRRVLLDATRPPSFDAPAVISGSGDAAAQADNAETGRHALRDVASRMGILDERVVAMFGERWAHLHAESNSPLRDEDPDYEPPSLTAMAVEPEFLESRRRLINPFPSEPYTVSSVRSTQAPNRPVTNPLALVIDAITSGGSEANDVQSRSPARPSVGVRIRRAVRERDMPRQNDFSSELAAYRTELLSRDRVSSRRRGGTQPPPDLAQVDGLGDRNRSLSPEGDNVWDTLLSTLTPDPQPPSVGSSFASASGPASAATSQSAAPTRSSATSFTGPDTIEESALEPPCESGFENSDTEGDEDEEAEQNPLMARAAVSFSNIGAPRSYADAVTRNSSFDDSDPLDIIGDVRGMQRIVRTLANREDIPDEWWAQVGLSRTLSREASTN